MRAFGLTALVFLGLLNGFLAHSGQALVGELNRSYTHHGIRLPGLTEIALTLPPWFYVLGGIAIAVAAFGLWRRALEKQLVYGAFAVLLFDVAGLFAMMWGCGLPFIMIGEVISR